jgi:hypothetical protein
MAIRRQWLDGASISKCILSASEAGAGESARCDQAPDVEDIPGISAHDILVR